MDPRLSNRRAVVTEEQYIFCFINLEKKINIDFTLSTMVRMIKRGFFYKRTSRFKVIQIIAIFIVLKKQVFFIIL